MFEWNVYISDFNAKVIEPYNVFDNASLLYDCKKNYAKNKDDREAFLEQLRRDLMQMPETYRQIAINWDRFCEYVWVHRGAFKKVRSKKNGQN